MTKVAILGASGMLGSMLVDLFARESPVELMATVRCADELARASARYPAVKWTLLDAESCTEGQLAEVLSGVSWAVNAIGLIKQHIVEGDDVLAERAVRLNALFSFMLARIATGSGCRVIQVATDCVYSGATGRYAESAAHDCLDVYGKSKSLGEVHASNVFNLRCSIIGPERMSGPSLLNWFLTRPPGITLNGFTNHLWNGVTTLHFARLCRAIVEQGVRLPNRQHVVPADTVSKHELLEMFAAAFGREDIAIRPTTAASTIDRTLATEHPDSNQELWRAAGYGRIPGIGEMVHELAEWQRRTTMTNAGVER